MKKIAVIMALLLWWLAVPTAYAQELVDEIDLSAETIAGMPIGWHAVASTDYEAVPFNAADLAAIAAVAVAWPVVAQGNPMVAAGILPVVAIGYGAWRTNQYRSDEAKAIVRANIAARNARPTVGTARWVLECATGC